MTREEMKELREGDIVRGKLSGDVYIVTANYGDRATAVVVRTVDITHADEWDLVAKSRLEMVEANDR